LKILLLANSNKQNITKYLGEHIEDLV